MTCAAMRAPASLRWSLCSFGRTILRWVFSGSFIRCACSILDFLCAFPCGALLILRGPMAVRSSAQRRQQISAIGLSELSLKRFAGRRIHFDPLERDAARHFLPFEQGEM